jgi:dUTP pyrophosphatase
VYKNDTLYNFDTPGAYMKYIKTRNVKDPTRGTADSAGIDFYIPNDFNNGFEYLLHPNDSVNIPSGIKVVLEPGTCGIFFNKSGIAVKGMLVGAQVIDADYRGEVHLNIHNTSRLSHVLKPGQKITQLIIQSIDLAVPKLITEDEYSQNDTTERGSGGFGSTGLN